MRHHYSLVARPVMLVSRRHTNIIFEGTFLRRAFSEFSSFCAFLA